MIEQVVNLRWNRTIPDGWERGQELTVHGWIHGVHDGLLRDLGIAIDHPEPLKPTLDRAIRDTALWSRDLPPAGGCPYGS